MSAEATAWARTAVENVSLSPTAQRTLLAIASLHRKQTGLAKASYADLASATRDSRRSVIYAVHTLLGLGLVDRIKQRVKQRQGVNAYALTMLPQSATIAPSSAASGCKIETSEVVHLLHPENRPQGAMVAPPNARACAVWGETLSLEEMEHHVWGAATKARGGRDA